MKKIYVIGSLRNPEIPKVAAFLRKGLGPKYEIFDDWFAAGPLADDSWQEYEKSKGISYPDALRGYAAQHVFQFDQHHLDSSDAAILVYPAGKSGHLELGYIAGQGKPTFIYIDKEPDRWDVMANFAQAVVFNQEDLLYYVKEFV